MDKSFTIKLFVMTHVVASAILAMAMPTKEELAEARPIVYELMSPFVVKFKQRTMSATEVGDKSLEFADIADTQATKYRFLNAAVSYYVRDKAYDKAADTIESIMKQFPDIAPETLLEMTTRATSGANAKTAPRLFAMYKAAVAQVKNADALKAVERELKKKPSDKTLVRRRAELMAAVGKWNAALEIFAGFHGDIGKMAQNEIDGKASAVELADFWWNYDVQEYSAQKTMRQHAVSYYRKAIDNGELKGLKRALAEKRIDEFSQIETATTSKLNNIGETPSVTRALMRLGAKKIEYLGGTGRGSDYINTGIVGKSEIKVDFMVSHWTIDWFCFGARAGYDKKAFCVGRINSSTLCFDYNSRMKVNATTDTTSKYRIVKDRQHNYCYDSAGTLIHRSTNPTTTSFNSGQTMYIFTANDGGSPMTKGGDTKRYYYFKIWDKSTLVRDFIPVRVGSTGYLFDRVSLKLFGNSGRGAFVLGPDL